MDVLDLKGALECGDGRTLVITAPAGTRFDLACPPTKVAPDLLVRSYQGLEVLEIGATRDPVELPLRLAGNQFTPLHVAVPRDGSLRRGELRLTQRRGDGELSAGFSLVA